MTAIDHTNKLVDILRGRGVSVPPHLHQCILFHIEEAAREAVLDAMGNDTGEAALGFAEEAYCTSHGFKVVRCWRCLDIRCNVCEVKCKCGAEQGSPKDEP